MRPLLVLALLATLAGCGGAAKGPPPAQIVAASTKATGAEKSFHFVYDEQHGPTAKKGLHLIFAEGDVVLPGDVTADVSGTLLGLPLRSALIVVGGHYYIRNPFTKAWQSVSVATNPVAFFNPAKGVLAVIAGATQLKSAGSDKGAWRVTGKVPVSAISPILGNAPSAKLVDVELWIDKQTSAPAARSSRRPGRVWRPVERLAYRRSLAVREGRRDQAAGHVLTPPLLTARGVTRSFGRRVVLESTDLDIGAGEVVALGGPNGAGKSTLLAILAGALRPSGGAVSQARVGWMPQRPALYGRLTPRENLELFARLGRLGDPKAAVDRALADVGLDVEERRAATLSVGNQQRLNLAIGLLGDPSVLLLDEPTASLDAERRGALWELVARVRDGGGGVVFATHNLDEARRVADRLLVLEEGRLVYEGTPGEYRE